MLPKTLNHNMYVERDHQKNVLLKCFDSGHLVKKDGHIDKSIT
jgi:hypothetical protein